MTFRRLKKVNSSGPNHTGPAAGQDIYFPSSKSDSCRTADLPGNSSEVYNYKTLAYSGGTLPRNFNKVRSQHRNFFLLLKSLQVYFLLMYSVCFCFDFMADTHYLEFSAPVWIILGMG